MLSMKFSHDSVWENNLFIAKLELLKKGCFKAFTYKIFGFALNFEKKILVCLNIYRLKNIMM